MSRRKHRRTNTTSLFYPYIDEIVEAYSQDALARICAMPEDDFGDAFGMQKVIVPQQSPSNYYYFRDIGSNILAVAHLDTVANAEDRRAHFVKTADGPVVFSRALDDRLGAYIILDMLPRLGINCNVLLTTGEEMGQSTASFFDPGDTDYNWMIEFDRGGTDVVTYQYEDAETTELVKATGATVGNGSFSDISMLEHLEIKGFNWGVGYREYHSARSHAFLDDTFEMVGRFLLFHDSNRNEYLPHEMGSGYRGWGHGSVGSGGWSWRDNDYFQDHDVKKAEDEFENGYDDWAKANEAIVREMAREEGWEDIDA